jgi:hypothetical protein
MQLTPHPFARQGKLIQPLGFKKTFSMELIDYIETLEANHMLEKDGGHAVLRCAYKFAKLIVEMMPVVATLHIHFVS